MASINPLLLETGAAPIPEVQAWRPLYDGRCGPLIDLAQAAPGYPPPQGMLERLAAAAGEANAATYGAVMGDRTLREAYAAHVAGLYGAEIDASGVAITAGANQAFFVALMAVASRGDAVLMPTPWYFNYEMAASMLGVEPRSLPTEAENGFLPDPDLAEALLDARVKAVVLVTPNNPTGAIYPPALIARFAELCRRRGIWLILDETYRDFLPPGSAAPHALFGDPDWGDTLIALYSFSKAYCIPGHRMGAMLAGEALAGQVGKVVDTLQICAPRPPQGPLTWAIAALAGWRADNTREILARAEAFRAAVQHAPGFRLEAIGAYFAYLRHPHRGVPASAVAEALIRRFGILCLPGPYFGAGQEGHLRIAFANAGIEALHAVGPRLRAYAESGMPAF